MSFEETFPDLSCDYKNVDISWCKLQTRHRRTPAGRNLLIDFLAICFGTGSWIAVNGIFVQLPLLVQTAPEGWSLPSYLSVVTQLANIGPILYTVSHRMWPGKIRDGTIIHILLAISAVTLFLLALFYKETTFVYSSERSTALLALLFVVSVVGCTSSVLFMPYMGNFHEIYLVSYFVGEGLSGFLPSVVTLVQGMGGNPTCVNQTELDGTVSVVPEIPRPYFSTQVFFFILFGIILCSSVAFMLLNCMNPCKNPNKLKFRTSIDNVLNSYRSGNIDSERDPSLKLREYKDSDMFNEVNGKPKPVIIKNSDFGTVENVRSSSTPISAYLLILVAWVCLLGNGIFPSIQSYSCLPYGNTAYHLSATLGSMANPVACFLAFFLPISSAFSISVLTSISTVISCFIATTAFASPSPPLLNTLAGEIIIVLCWIVNTGLISYVKMSIASLYRREEGRALFWCGAVQQLGSAVGALVAFTLVNYTNLFASYHPCE